MQTRLLQPLQRATRDAAPQALGWDAALDLAFQVVDDILDATQDSQTLGKTAGKDAAQDKPTYVTLLGLERASRQAQVLYEEALEALRDSGLADTRALAALAQRVIERTH